MATKRLKKPKAIRPDGTFDWTADNIYEILRYKETTMLPYEVVIFNFNPASCKWLADLIDKAKQVDEVLVEVGLNE